MTDATAITNTSALPLVTIVCPVFNEEQTVPLFYERLKAALAPAEAKVRFEILFMNNRSTDGTLAAIEKLRAIDPRVQVITFSRNFGYQASITAGMQNARGDAVMNIDVDCEDPPEMIPQFVDLWLNGADVAYGIREKRNEFYLMHLGRKLFYRVTRAVADHDIVLDMAEFFLVDKRVRDAALKTRSTFPFVRGQTGYAGFKRQGIAYTRQRRIIGETHYNLFSAGKFGIAGILSSSTFPLRLLAYIGVLGFVADLALAVYAFDAPRKATELMPGVMFLNLSWLMFSLAMVGIYLARVYKDTAALPLYIIDTKHTTYPVEAKS
jgi:polyisoprenyl-phosphate glycosyltransferase